MHDIQVIGRQAPGSDTILTDDAVSFIADLHHRFDDRRRTLLSEREVRQHALDGGARFDFLTETGQGSTSWLQRKLSIGYNRAARMMEHMEREGVVGPAGGSRPRKVLAQAMPR